MSDITLTDIERGCREYDQECAKLEELVIALNAELSAVKQKHLLKLKTQARVVANREAQLHEMTAATPSLFVKPRTVIYHGTKVGLTTSAGKLEFDDEESVIAAIDKHFPDRVDELVKKERTLFKDVVKRLDEAELKKIGCRIEGEGDAVVLKRVGGDVDKLVDKLIEKMVDAMIGES